MRPAFLIVASNLIAFMLGVAVTLWISNGPPSSAPSNVAVAVPATAASATPGPSAIPPSAAAPQPPAAGPAAASPPPAALSPAPARQAATPAAASAPAPASGSAARGAYVLRFGAFTQGADAALMQAELKKFGYATDVVLGGAGGNALRVVQIGGFTDRNAAAEAASSVQRDTGISGLLTKSVPQ